MLILCKKLKRVKDVLKDFNKNFSKIIERVLMARKAMKDVQCLIQQIPIDLDIHKAESTLVKEFVRLAQAEESFLRQKSRV
jgi:hypothetical protein